MEYALLSKIAAAMVLVALNAFFVVSEFAMVGVRRSWVQAQVDDGHRRAKLLLSVIDNLDQYFSAMQLGITAASLALGWLGEAAFAELLLPWIERAGIPGAVITSHAAATAGAFVIITTLHIIFGELVPRAIALQTPERVAMLVVVPMVVVQRLLIPLAGVLNQVSRGVLKLLRIKPPGALHRFHSQDELRILVEQSHKGGVLAETEQRLLTSVFDFSEKKVDAIMTPRTEIVAVPEDMKLHELISFTLEDQHSRLPVYKGTLDQIVGTLNIKQLMAHALKAKNFAMADVVREPFFVPPMKPLADLLKEMQHRQDHMAIVVDEFGGTQGLVTLEDLLEEIVGEIFDEFDVEKAGYETQADGDVILDGRTNVDRVNALFGAGFSEEDYHTIGGLVFGLLGRAPKVGDVVEAAGRQLRVEEVRARRVSKVRLARGKNLGRG